MTFSVALKNGGIGENAVGDRTARSVICDDFAAAHTHFADDSADGSAFNSVTDAEWGIRDNDQSSEKIGNGILCRQSKSKSDNTGTGEQG